MTPGVDVLSGLPSPVHSFASDNSAGVHPKVMEALQRANSGHALAYGADRFTEAANRRFDELFGRPVDVFYTWGGTGANVMALASMWRPGGSVICTDMAHIHVDETAAPERIVGIKLHTVPHHHGKLTADQIEGFVHYLGVQHHPQPCGVSITQSSEYGTLYSADEVGAICEMAHRHGMKVHMDGARIANAAAAGRGLESLRAFTVDVGVDVISFGGTKNGMMYGEAVVFLDRSLAGPAPFIRKQVGQLPSKMRFVSAQFEALLSDDLWLQTAAHANDLAGRLYGAVREVPGLEIRAPEVNAVFPILEPGAAAALAAWSPFYEWDPARHEVRWMCSWDTTEDDVQRFADGVRRVLGVSTGGR